MLEYFSHIIYMYYYYIFKLEERKDKQIPISHLIPVGFLLNDFQTIIKIRDL